MFALSETSYRSYLGALAKRHVVVWLMGMWLAIVVSPRVARAQSDADRATARNLAAEGHTALRTQDCVTAEDRFRRADALVHAPTLVVEHARALICLKRFVEAQERLSLVLREGVAENAPWVWKKSLQDAEQLVGDAKPKVAWLTINVSGPSEPTVLVDGVQVPVVALGVRRATDPGKRHISAAAPGFSSKEISVTMPEGGERAVTLDLPVDPTYASVTQAAPAEKPKENPLLRSNPPRKPSNAPAYVAFGLGGAGLAVGTVTGIIALGKRSDLKDKYDCGGGECRDPAARPVLDDYHRYGIISGIGFGVGVASTGVGLWLFLSNASKAPKDAAAPAKASVLPYATLGEVGLVGAF